MDVKYLKIISELVFPEISCLHHYHVENGSKSREMKNVEKKHSALMHYLSIFSTIFVLFPFAES